MFYRSGFDFFFILHNNDDQFAAMNQDGVSRRDGEKYDLFFSFDQVLAFDYSSKDSVNYLLNFRPEMGALWIIRKNIQLGQSRTVAGIDSLLDDNSISRCFLVILKWALYAPDARERKVRVVQTMIVSGHFHCQTNRA